jgi:hypothetical protein
MPLSEMHIPLRIGSEQRFGFPHPMALEKCRHKPGKRGALLSQPGFIHGHQA